MQKISILSFLLVLVACSSKTATKKKPKITTEYSCSLTNNLLGKQYLNEKFITAIQQIKTDPKKLHSTQGMVQIKGGSFAMGGDIPEHAATRKATALAQPDEFPKHRVKVNDFYIDEHEVTVGEYLEFVQKTGYKTVAEYDVDWEELKKQLPENTVKPTNEQLKAGALVFHLAPRTKGKESLANWWVFTQGANWKNPDAQNKDITKFLNYPVTQISWYDAQAYAKWQGKRLPTEAEFEYAMRAGNENTMYPWGNTELEPNSYKGNFLQGDFPYTNTGADGFLKRAPVQSFAPNAYGLYDIAGNVWEWTNDWYAANYYKLLSDKDTLANNPLGPEKTFEVFDAYATNKVVRGGSFLCNDSWCSGYRNARRMRLSPDSGMEHLGFRCVRDIPNTRYLNENN